MLFSWCVHFQRSLEFVRIARLSQHVLRFHGPRVQDEFKRLVCASWPHITVELEPTHLRRPIAAVFPVAHMINGAPADPPTADDWETTVIPW